MSSTGSPKGGTPKIGIFDSGLGGLTVVRAVLERLPGESIVYLGDTARVPYGTRSADTVIRYARSCSGFLTERGVKVLVVACNTVSAVALDLLQAELDLPVVGVVEPGAKAAVVQADQLQDELSLPVRLGVLGTSRTVASGAYERAVARLSTRYEVVSRAAPLLVPLVEEGWLEGQVVELVIERYLKPLIDEGARVLVLGCTHYPLLAPTIERIACRLAGQPVRVVDSAVATADALVELMAAGRMKRAEAAAPDQQRLELFVTDLPQSFHPLAERFLGSRVPSTRQIDLTVKP